MRAFLIFAAFAAILALTWTQAAAFKYEQDNVEALFEANEYQGHENESDREARQIRHGHGIGGGFGRGFGGGIGQGRGIGGGFGHGGGFGRGVGGGYGGGIGGGFGGGFGGGLGGGHGQGGYKRGGYHG